MDVIREEKFENEGLVKCYDRQGRIVEIAFLQSGNGCTIQYIGPDSLPDERIVRWKSGEVFRTWKEEGKTKFTRLQDEQDWHY
jgi:hypothetical protein